MNKKLEGQMIALYILQYNGGSLWTRFLPNSLAMVVVCKMLQGRKWLKGTNHWLNR